MIHSNIRPRPTRWLALALPAAVALRGAVAGAQTAAARPADVVYDFVATPPHNAARAEDAVAADVVRRFPHPTAGAGARCDVNARGTPPAERMGGILLPTVTTATGAFTRAGAQQTAYFVDYCATGMGQDAIRRLIVLEGSAVVFDGRVADAERILLARDVDADGRDELLLLHYTYAAGRVGVVAQLVALGHGRFQARGRWNALRECGLGSARRTGLRLVRARAASGFSLRAEPVSEVCAWPPSAP